LHGKLFTWKNFLHEANFDAIARATNDQAQSGFVRLSLKISLKHFSTNFHLLITSWNISVSSKRHHMAAEVISMQNL
jgi:hypothetical protein